MNHFWWLLNVLSLSWLSNTSISLKPHHTHSVLCLFSHIFSHVLLLYSLLLNFNNQGLSKDYLTYFLTQPITVFHVTNTKNHYFNLSLESILITKERIIFDALIESIIVFSLEPALQLDVTVSYMCLTFSLKHVRTYLCLISLFFTEFKGCAVHYTTNFDHSIISLTRLSHCVLAFL